MTVYQNVLCGAEAAAGGTPIATRRQRAARQDAVHDVLGTLGLEHVAATAVGTLSYGTKKLVELARVFVRRPAFVLLDEPVAGLNRNEKAEFAELFSRLRTTYSLSGVLVEHDMPTVQSVCSRVMVLDAGNQIAQGPVAETLMRPEVVAAYLGPLALSGDA